MSDDAQEEKRTDARGHKDDSRDPTVKNLQKWKSIEFLETPIYLLLFQAHYLSETTIFWKFWPLLYMYMRVREKD